MSKWTEVRDSLVEAMKLEDIGKNLKADFVTWLSGEGLDFAQEVVDQIIAECKKDAPTETGWCKIRDAFVVPVALNVVMYVLKTVMTKAAEESK
jgi:hypothetical protein